MLDDENIVIDSSFNSDTSKEEKDLIKAKNSKQTSLSQINALNNEELVEMLETLENEEKLLNNEIDDEEQRYNTLKFQAESIRERINEYNNTLSSANSETIDTLKTLLSDRDEIKENETSFKREYRRQIEELEAQIEKYNRPKNETNGNFFEDETNKKNKKHENLQLISFLMSEITKLNNTIFDLELEVEKYPSQIELNQYHRRFLELYNQMSGKYLETKKYYAIYNTLVDIRNLIKREIDLLNSIDDSKNLTLNENYKDSFVENLQGICRSVEQSLDKVLCGKNILQDQRDTLAENLQTIIDKERFYMKTVAEFQTECQKNEKLKKELELKQNND